MTNRFLTIAFGFCLAVGMSVAAFAGPAPTGGPDTDGDTIEDEFDNCIDPANQGSVAFNPDQADADHDGCGDTCDTIKCDINLDGTVSIIDFGALAGCFGMPASCEPAADCGGAGPDGTISIIDFGQLAGEIGDGTGPTGHTVASFIEPNCQ